ncbi:MAG: hypothetical protein KKA22_14850 [Gammaproteobacteria bacterium]|nr:hypothetical protein [Gammaproteobacteria bacterium]MBU1409415.1 hypothetical protein [Gammaproteobacteria bacterium]MBU1530597.1 hypothetical protein [Gammaproteobacteria bacterium]
MDKIQPNISREDYPTFAGLLKNDPEFPASHILWSEQAEKQSANALSHGQQLNVVQIYPQEFADYCRACGQKPNLTMLGAFAVAKNHRNA